MTMLDHYVRAGDMRPRGTFSYVSDFDAWPETTPAAAPSQRDRAAGSGPARPTDPKTSRERSFA